MDRTASARLHALLPLPLSTSECAVCHETRDTFGVTACSMPLTNGHEPNCCFQCWVRHLASSARCPFCRANVQRVMEVSAAQLLERRDVYHATRTSTYSLSRAIGAYAPIHVVTVNNEPQVITVSVRMMNDEPTHRRQRPRRQPQQHVQNPDNMPDGALPLPLPLPDAAEALQRNNNNLELLPHVITAMRRKENAAKLKVFEHYAYLRGMQESVAALRATGFQFCTLTIPQLLQCPALIHAPHGTCQSCHLPVHLHNQ
jgi:hypothetical protein